MKYMRVLKATRENIQLAAETVRKGGLIIYPTDTVYGLGCDPFNVAAVKRVFEVKERTEKPLPVLAYSLEEVKRIAEVTEKALKIAERFWPGSVTLVLHKKPALPELVTCGRPSVGVRVPNHKVTLELLKLSGGLLIGTSANRSGGAPPRTVEEAVRQIGEKVDLILDDGDVPLGKPSTIVDLTVDPPELLREGPVGRKEMLKVFRRLTFKLKG